MVAGRDELERVRRQLADLEELLDAGFWDYDVATGVVGWSAGQRRLYGVGDDFDATYDNWFALVHPDDRDVVGARIAEAIETVGEYAFEHRLTRADDGRERWTRCRGRVLAGPDGAAERVLGVSTDTTDEHTAAEVQAAFLANAAHELRTPAAAIGQAVQALRVTDDESVRAEIVAALARQSSRLRHLTTNLVDLASFEAEAASAPAAPHVEPMGLAAAVADALVNAAVPPDRSIAVDIPGELKVLAEPDQLDRVLVNLLTNAWRYGGPNVALRAARHVERDEVVLEVADDGVGVPSALGPVLFEPFRRGPQRHPEASGLGLAIVDRLMRRLGGSVAYRDGGPGAVFALTFRAAP